MCAYVQRARNVLNEKDIQHDVEYIDPHMPPDWFFDVSPLEKVPVLLVDDQPLFESMVICDYIDEVSDGSLYPADPFERAQHRAWIAFADGLLGVVYDLLNAADETEFKRIKATVVDRLDVLEDELEIKKFFAGDNFSMVDIAYAPIFRFLTGIYKRTDLDLFEDTPQIKAWAERVLARSSVAGTVPEDYPQRLQKFLTRPDRVMKSLVTK